jgi:hypothetical protein
MPLVSICQPMAKIKLAGRSFDLPKNRIVRILIGVFLILFGFLGFLPILGFWMIPLGFLVLSVDIPAIRRWRRQAQVRLGQWLKANYPSLAQRLGYTNGNKRSERPGRSCDLIV